MTTRAAPIVGVTTYRQQASWGPWDRLATVLPASYVDTVAAAGGRPVLLPPSEGGGTTRPPPRASSRPLTRSVLVGGGDIDPARYGQVAHAATSGVDPGRDASELALLRAALGADLPVLAICRGMQLLNVDLGGTLVQHVPDVVGHDGHQPARGCFADVEVVTEAGSMVAKIVGETGHRSLLAPPGHRPVGRGTGGDGPVGRRAGRGGRAPGGAFRRGCAVASGGGRRPAALPRHFWMRSHDRLCAVAGRNRSCREPGHRARRGRGGPTGRGSRRRRRAARGAGLSRLA